tara:strand:- start:33 stop:656 length:624 start_codon:yes stop_codon:yes gene_type:complete
MNNIYRIIILIPVVILGCTFNTNGKNEVLQKINSLDMDIFSQKGDKIYSISSPYSSYDNNQLKFQLKNTTINIFNGDLHKYIINSDASTLSDNNKILELTGNVKLKTIKKDDDFLFGDYLFWNIDETYFILKGNVKFENKNITLTSTKAIMGSDNIIEFYDPVKYTIKNDNNENLSEINSENAYYDVNTETLSFKAKDKKVRSKIYF